MNSVELKFVMRGNLQGVGFRKTAQKLANELKLKGFVQNLPDGSIELVVQGQLERIHLLIDRLKNSFIVIEIDETSHPLNKYHLFEIR